MDTEPRAIPTNRTLYLFGSVDDDLAYKAISSLQSLDSTEGDILIVLNSDGGDESAGFAIYDAITMCRNRVTIDAYGNVLSIAAAIFQAADHRRMAPNATFLIHNGTIDTQEESIQQTTLLDMAAWIKKDSHKYYLILSQGSGQSMETIERWCRDETLLDAREAVRDGFADAVLEPLKVRGAVQKKTRKKKK